MAAQPTPREIVKGLLQGIAAPRPLFLPIVFSAGSRVADVSLRAFMDNPTKISNSLRQIRGHLPSDGLACYFDLYLEAESLGGTLQWGTEEQPPTLHWPPLTKPGELPPGLRTPEEAAKSSRVAVAVEVIRRLRTLRRDDSLLMAGLTGPYTLAARITQLELKDPLRSEDLPERALEIAAAVISQIAAALVEAGANLVFIQEKVLPALSAEGCEAWASLLAPAFNIIRFYEALPVLQLTDTRSFAQNSEVIFQREWDCVVCPALPEFPSPPSERFSALKAVALGISLPLEVFQPDRSEGDRLQQYVHQIISELRPAILTTAGDVPPMTDMKRIIEVCDYVRR
ncbi:MAG TPA: uroporphyrinogen decarboxylase family protein [Candidatus Acidoferrum sp.]|nr:uroporphyrinogen decarboxylase family protein [Candidatus Acidoferrum sp.]